MSRMAAIDVALRHQLISDGHPTGDYKKSFGTDFKYDKNTIQLFLLNVANRLRLDEPSLRLDWRNLDTGRCLDANLVVMIGQIEAAMSSEAKA